jgi:uncharacterized membrane protein YfcA
MNRTLTFILIGTLSGIITGLTGLGHASFILVGLTLTNLLKNYDTVIGTCLYAQMLPVVMFGVWEYYKKNQIDFYAGNILLATGFLSIFIGAKLNNYIHDSYIKIFTGILFLLFGVQFLYEGTK